MSFGTRMGRRGEGARKTVMAGRELIFGLLLSFIFLNTEVFSAANGSSQKMLSWKETGPRTESITLAPYARIYYLSAGTGSDQKGDGSRSKPWRSIHFSLGRIEDATASKRYALFVGEGLYAEDTLRMKPHVDLYGGFEAKGWSRDIFEHATLLDGIEQRRVLLGSDNARLDGFRIGRGRVRGMGAGMLCEGVSPIISNNVFHENMSLGPEPWNPAYRHEIGNEGGALTCLNGASPKVEHNLFLRNRTEIGRGAGIACHINSSPLIAQNVFIDNISGIADPMRSSDGGAISLFDHSNARLEGNILLRNEAASENDGGGIFIALWSSAVLSRNILVDNYGGDDGGGIFVGGQEHRYNRPLDPVPPADAFFVLLEDNVVIGNRNKGGTSGAMRITMESRVRLVNNVIALNPGGVYLQRSALALINNTVAGPIRYVKLSEEGLDSVRLLNNVITGPLNLKSTVAVEYNLLKKADENLYGKSNISGQPHFLEDGIKGLAVRSAYDPPRVISTVEVAEGHFAPGALAGRIIRFGKFWSVIRGNDRRSLEMWGTLQFALSSAAPRSFLILPTYHLAPDSPGIDAGTSAASAGQDIDGDPRPLFGGHSLAVDMGADEFKP